MLGLLIAAMVLSYLKVDTIHHTGNVNGKLMQGIESSLADLLHQLPISVECTCSEDVCENHPPIIIDGTSFVEECYRLTNSSLSMFLSNYDGLNININSTSVDCNPVPCISVNCSSVACNPTDCNSVPCSPTNCNSVPCSPTNCNSVPCDPVSCYAVVCDPVPCITTAVECISVPCDSISCTSVPCDPTSCTSVPCQPTPCTSVACGAVPCTSIPCSINETSLMLSIDKYTSMAMNKSNAWQHPALGYVTEMNCTVLGTGTGEGTYVSSCILLYGPINPVNESVINVVLDSIKDIQSKNCTPCDIIIPTSAPSPSPSPTQLYPGCLYDIVQRDPLPIMGPETLYAVEVNIYNMGSQSIQIKLQIEKTADLNILMNITCNEDDPYGYAKICSTITLGPGSYYKFSYNMNIQRLLRMQAEVSGSECVTQMNPPSVPYTPPDPSLINTGCQRVLVSQTASDLSSRRRVVMSRPNAVPMFIKFNINQIGALSPLPIIVSEGITCDCRGDCSMYAVDSIPITMWDYQPTTMHDAVIRLTQCTIVAA